MMVDIGLYNAYSIDMAHKFTEASLAYMHPETRQARLDQIQYQIPEERYQAWRSQWFNSRSRNIPFEFSLKEWCDWWDTELKKIGPKAQRGCGLGQYVMARLGDTGPYAPNNVHCITLQDNTLERSTESWQKSTAKATASLIANGTPRGFHWRGVKTRSRGADNVRSKAVITPIGKFVNLREAGEAYGVSGNAIGLRLKRKWPGYRFVE
jgi:hypothetical protein